MKEYKIEDLTIGVKEKFSVNITESMMQKFFDITGDENPLHRDKEFAQSRGFKAQVVYGMLTASLLSTLGGCYLPGKFCLIQGVDIKFSKPVFIGDNLTVIGIVNKIDITLKYIEIKVTIKNQKDEKVLRGILKVGILNE